MTIAYRDPVEFYRDHAEEYDRTRSRELVERAWLDRFLTFVPAGGSVLDAGCGSGEPIATYLIAHDVALTGFDTSAPLLALARQRLPKASFVEDDLRSFDLGCTFDGVIAWDSFFHLGWEEQLGALDRFAAHCNPRAAIMFTSGPSRSTAINPLFGEPLFHASHEPSDYRNKLDEHGFAVLDHIVNDPDCGGHTVWIFGRGMEQDQQ